MRIVIVASESSSFHDYTGGVGQRFEALARRFARWGHDVSLVLLDAGVSLEQVSREREIRVTLVRQPRGSAYSVLRDLRTAWAFRRVIARERPDVILAAEWGGFCALLRRSDRRRLVTNLATSSRLVRELEGDDGRGPRTRLRDGIRDHLERRQTLRSAGVISISRALAEWSARVWGVVGEMEVIPNSVDPGLSATAPAESDPTTGLEVVSVGRVCRWKGSDVLFDACEALWRSGRRFSLIFIGRVEPALQAESSDWTDRAARVGGSLELVGHVIRAEALGRMRSADVAVFPSLFEGFGNACLEAKFLGVATVATEGSGFDEFCESGVDSLLVPPGHAGKLAAAIERLLIDADMRARIARAGQARAQSYSIDEYARRMLVALGRFSGEER